MDTVAVTEIECDVENNGLTAPIPREDALLVTLQLRDCASHELWLDGKARRTPALSAGTTSIYDLRQCPIVNSISAFHNLHFYLPRAALDAIAAAEGTGYARDFGHNPGEGVDDPVIRGLGRSLVPALRRPAEACELFVDYVMTGVAAHVVRLLGDGRPLASEPRGLGPWQERRAQELLSAHLDGHISVQRLAEECRLPTTAFCRGFRASTGVLPHRWLLERRIDRAITLLRRPKLPLRQVARRSGFASESHLVLVFRHVMGMHPTAWRGGTADAMST